MREFWLHPIKFFYYFVWHGQSHHVFSVPGDNRLLVQVMKPGAYGFERGGREQHDMIGTEIEHVRREASSSHQRTLDAGVPREVAGAAFPVSLYSSIFVATNTRSLMNLLSFRTKRGGTLFPSFPRREIEMVAERMKTFWAPLMPTTSDASTKNGRVAIQRNLA